MPPAVVELIPQFLDFNYLFVFSHFFKIFISKIQPIQMMLISLEFGGALLAVGCGPSKLIYKGIRIVLHWLPFPELSVNKLYTEGNHQKAQELQKQNPSAVELWIRLSFFSRIIQELVF